MRVDTITDEIPALSKVTDTGSAIEVAYADGRGLAWVFYGQTDASLTREQAVEMGKDIARHVVRNLAPL